MHPVVMVVMMVHFLAARPVAQAEVLELEVQQLPEIPEVRELVVYLETDELYAFKNGTAYTFKGRDLIAATLQQICKIFAV